MNWKPKLALLGVVPLMALALAPSAVAHGGGDNIIRGTLTGSTPGDVTNNVNAGGFPWIISRGDVRVRESGRMDIRIEGLLIPAPSIFSQTEPVNPVGNIHAVLYCSGMFAADSGSQPMTKGTGPDFGNARFRVHLMVPEMCDMPSVLIQPDDGTGNRAPAYIASLVAMGDDDDD